MYSKEQAAKIRSQFWTTFGKYMQPVPSVFMTPVNWVNYKTGVKQVRFLMEVDRNRAEVFILFNTKDEALLNQFQPLIQEMVQQLNHPNIEWTIDKSYYRENEVYTRVFAFIDGVNIYNQDSWPSIISFFKTAMILIDQMWLEQKEIFEMLTTSKF